MLCSWRVVHDAAIVFVALLPNEDVTEWPRWLHETLLFVGERSEVHGALDMSSVHGGLLWSSSVFVALIYTVMTPVAR